jgi:hypothetical protein
VCDHHELQFRIHPTLHAAPASLILFNRFT